MRRSTRLPAQIYFCTRRITCLRRSTRLPDTDLCPYQKITCLRRSIRLLDTDFFPFYENYLYEKKHQITWHRFIFITENYLYEKKFWLHDTELPPWDYYRTWNYSDMSRITCVCKRKRFQTRKPTVQGEGLADTELSLTSRIKYLYE